jgi:hypothetical protein
MITSGDKWFCDKFKYIRIESTMQKSFQMGSFERAYYQNQFTFDTPVPSGLLNHPDWLYFITAVESAGAWVVEGVGFNLEPFKDGADWVDLRTITRSGSGNHEFIHPLALGEIKLLTNVTRICGFIVKKV